MGDGPNPQAIRAMFARVAARYDLLNRLLSLGQDQRWRVKLRRAVAAWAPPGPILDLATGTGDVALGFEDRAVFGGDFCLDMLAVAKRKANARGANVRWVALDGMSLPFRRGSLAAVTVAFGVRNFPDRRKGLSEIVRVLVPGGVLAVLEFHPVEKPLSRLLHAFWQRAVISPVGGWISGDAQAYRYLPQSSQQFLTRQQLAELGQAFGLRLVESFPVGLGVAAVTVFVKGGET